MKTLKHLFIRLPDMLSFWAGQVTGASIIIMIVIITLDVILRHLGTSTYLGDEYSGYLLVVIIFLGAGEVLRKKEHIRVKLIITRFREKWRLLFDLMTFIMGLALVLVFCWLSISLVLNSYSAQEMTYSIHSIPRFIVQLPLPIGLICFAIQIMSALLRQARFVTEAFMRSDR